MPVRICCPSCKAIYSVEDGLRGKKILCRECDKPLQIPGPVSPAASPPAPKKVEQQVAPAKPKAAPAKTAAIKPAPAKKAPAPAPVPRRAAAKDVEIAPKRSRLPLLLALGGIGAVGAFLLLVVAGGAAFLLWPSSKKTTDTAGQVANNTARDTGSGGTPTAKDTGKQPAKGGGGDNQPGSVGGSGVPVDNPDKKPADTIKETTPEPKQKPSDKPVDKPKDKVNPPVQSGQLDPAVLAKVKQATVYIRVTLANGSVAQGSGFFGVEPGLVLTNAHVLDMLDVGNPPPKKVEIVYKSGEKDSRTFVAQILGVDRSTDLGLLRIQATDLPEPLIVKSSAELMETQTVYVVGFPFGDQLGKNITVSQTSISSLRKAPTGEMNQVQVNGGMHPGNSGGPVINSSGDVIGVAVAGIKGTQINFAVPAEYVHVILNGRATGISGGATVKDGDQLKMRINVSVLDPLKRVKKVALEWWTGNNGPPRPPTNTPPQPQPGDSPHQLVDMVFQGGNAYYDIVLPPDLKSPQQIWAQPVVTNGVGQQRWAGAVNYAPTAPQAPLENLPGLLVQKNTWGARPLTVVSNAVLTITKPGQKAESDYMKMTAEVTETMTAEQEGAASLRMRYHKFAVSYPKTTFNDEERGQLQKALNKIGLLHANLLVDKNNNLKKNEVDPGPLVKSPNEIKKYLQFMHGQVQDSLEMLWIPLPGREVKPGESWKATRPLIVPALPDIPMQMTFTYKGVRQREGRPEAVITIQGIAKDKVGKYPVNGQVTGFAYFDLTTAQISHAAVNGKLELNGGAEGKVTATLDSKLTRTLGKDVLMVRDQLTATDPVDAKKCPFKVHGVQLEGGKPCVISLESFKGPGLFDTYVRLEDMNGKVLAQDDDHGVDLNSLIVFTPPATGQYRIVATCFQPATGNYLLTVRQ